MSNGDLPEISNGFSNEQSDSIVDLVSTKIFWTLTLESITRRASNNMVMDIKGKGNSHKWPTAYTTKRKGCKNISWLF
jgi:hypothetical protein